MRQRKILENLPKYKKMYLKKKYRLGIDNNQYDHIYVNTKYFLVSFVMNIKLISILLSTFFLVK